MKKLKFTLIIIITLLVIAYLILGVHFNFNIDYLHSQQSRVQQWINDHYLAGMLLYFCGFILVAALCLPGVAVMTVAGGIYFGFITGLVLASFAASIAAMLTFWGSRYLFVSLVHRYFHKQLQLINQGIDKEGAYYLFALRMIPVFPYSIINLVMGITSMRTLVFYCATQLGMLPITFILVNAGDQLADVVTIKDIFSLPLLLSLALIGIFPIIVKHGLEYARKVRAR